VNRDLIRGQSPARPRPLQPRQGIQRQIALPTQRQHAAIMPGRAALMNRRNIGGILPILVPEEESKQQRPQYSPSQLVNRTPIRQLRRPSISGGDINLADALADNRIADPNMRRVFAG